MAKYKLTEITVIEQLQNVWRAITSPSGVVVNQLFTGLHIVAEDGQEHYINSPYTVSYVGTKFTINDGCNCYTFTVADTELTLAEIQGVVTWEEADPVYSGSPAAGITEPMISNWNTPDIIVHEYKIYEGIPPVLTYDNTGNNFPFMADYLFEYNGYTENYYLALDMTLIPDNIKLINCICLGSGDYTRFNYTFSAQSDGAYVNIYRWELATNNPAGMTGEGETFYIKFQWVL